MRKASTPFSLPFTCPNLQQIHSSCCLIVFAAGFFNIPVDHLFFTPVLVDYLKTKNLKDVVIVSPDAGGVDRARHVAMRMDAQLAVSQNPVHFAFTLIFIYFLSFFFFFSIISQ
jgi:hypothetical protein